MQELLTILLLVGSGTTAGVLFAVALSVVPAFAALQPERYVETHKLVGRRFDHVMPAVVLASTLIGAWQATEAADTTARTLFGTAAAFGLAVSLVSQMGNVPINRKVKRLPAGPVPDGWDDPRRRWRAWHLLRTSCAVAALVLNASAVVLATA